MRRRAQTSSAALELGEEKGGDDLAGAIRRTDILPCVFVDLTAKEAATGWCLYRE